MTVGLGLVALTIEPTRGDKQQKWQLVPQVSEIIPSALQSRVDAVRTGLTFPSKPIALAFSSAVRDQVETITPSYIS